MQHQPHVLLFFTVLVAILYNTKAQTFELSKCRNIQGVNYVDYDKLKGVWYEYARSPSAQEDNSRCITYIVSTPVKGETPTERLQLDKFLFWEYPDVTKSNSTITGAGKGAEPDGFKYTYLDVDYDEYLVAYNCKNNLLGSEVVTYILTRKRFPPCDAILKSYDVLWEYGLSVDKMKKTNQTDCPNTWDDTSNIFPELRG